MLEIYNEKLRDLLNPSNSKLNIVKNKKTGINVQGLSQTDCKDEGQVMGVLDKAVEARSVACTNMNASSSRSHMVITLHLEQYDADDTSNEVLNPERQQVLGPKKPS